VPNYSFRNKDSGEEFVLFMKMAEKDEYLNANPHIESFISHAPALHSGQGLGVRKVDDGFKEVLNSMKKKIPGNTINT
jgi:hypothetical protein